MTDPVKHEAAPAGFERQDMGAHSVYASLGGLAAGVVLVAVVLWGLYDATDAYERNHQPAQSPLVQQTQAETREVSPNEIDSFPQPRLERNERLDINQFRLQEEQSLNSYGWVDQKAGVVRIPIDRAMQLIAQRGLPATPKAGGVPAAQMKVANQTVHRPDTSNLPGARGKKQ